MPNGGADYCYDCTFNENKGAHAGRCTIRDLPLGTPFFTYCVNQTYHNPRRISVPIGPVVERDTHHVGPSRVMAESPDTEEIRSTLLTLVRDIREQPHFEYGSPPYFDEMVVWQLGEFREQRALGELQRIAAFEKSLQRRGGPSRWLVAYAEDAILKVLGVASVDPVGQLLYS